MEYDVNVIIESPQSNVLYPFITVIENTKSMRISPHKILEVSDFDV